MILDNVSVSVNQGEKIGLVGVNGTGKTTFMKLLDGKVKPTSGKIQRSGNSFYVPQLDNRILRSEEVLWKYLQRYLNDWWLVQEHLERIFGWKEINVNQPLKTFSGGELVKIFLCLGFAKNPDILLLDEPTNHLDFPSIEALINALQDWKKSFITISHNTYFLNSATNTTWLLQDKDIRVYGGNYDYYKVQYQQEIEAQKKDYSAELKKKNKIEESIRKEQKRAARSQKVGKDLKGDHSMSNIEKGFFANKASIVAGKNKDKLLQIKSDSERRLKELKIKESKNIYLEIDKGNLAKGRLLFDIRNTSLSIEKKELLKIPSFKMYVGDRIAILGANGTGKTLFVKTLLNSVVTDSISLTGDINISPKFNSIYLSQKYEIVDPSLTLVENVQKVNKKINYETVRRLLGNFLFKNEETIIKNADVLSGGETARLAMAMITASPVDLVVLDEPTNNLDIDTIDAMEESLRNYEGGLLTITHDLDFLRDIGIEQVFVVNQGELVKLEYSPSDEIFEKKLKDLLLPK